MAFFTNTPSGLTLINGNDTFANQAISSGFATPSAIVGSYLNASLNNSVVSTNVLGANTSGYFVDRLFLQGVVDELDGLFLTSGGIPDTSNTQPNFSVANGTPGDADLDSTATAAFPFAGPTQDAAIIEFTVNVTNPVIDGISFNLFFGSEEFPEFSNTAFTDIAAVYVNGVNYALFDGDPSAPLSIIDGNLNKGNFLDNTAGIYPIEWDGIIELLSIRAPLNQGFNSIKIGVADTGDLIYDSGLFINDFNFESEGGVKGGIFTVVDGSPDNDNFQANEFAEEFNLISGEDVVSGTPSELDGDIITGFSTDDSIVVTQSTFSDDDITVTLGSAILDIDTNNDNVSDTQITLTGDFTNVKFSTNVTDSGTEITAEQDIFVRTVLDSGNSNINIDGQTNEFVDFGGVDTYTILGSLSGDVTITDNDVSIINLPNGINVSDVLFLSDGVQFTIDNNTVTLLGAPSSFTYVFGGTPLNANVGTQLNYSETAEAFGTFVPVPSSPPNAATITGTINDDGTVGDGLAAMSLVGASSLFLDAGYDFM